MSEESNDPGFDPVSAGQKFAQELITKLAVSSGDFVTLNHVEASMVLAMIHRTPEAALRLVNTLDPGGIVDSMRRGFDQNGR